MIFVSFVVREFSFFKYSVVPSPRVSMLRTSTALAAVWLSTASLAQGQPVELIAHRGASHDAPENTLAAFRLAWNQNADGVECDVQLTKDGRVIVCHDDSTKRIAGVDLKIAETTLERLQTLDAGSFKDPKFKGERLPSLEELLAIMPEGKKLYIEVKCGPEVISELIRQLELSEKLPAETPVICFNAAVVSELKQQLPDLPVYFLHNPEKITAKDLVAQAKSLNADGVDLKACKELDAAYARKILDAGLRLDVWTVDDPAEARRLIELGVKGITTNRPGFLREEALK